MTTAVWMGDPTAETPMTNVGGIAVFGATYPADVWRDFMKAALANVPPTDFVPPDQKLWPRSQYIDDQKGRGTSYYSSYSSSNYSTTSTVPFVAPPPSGTTVPPIVSPTTAPPVTVPHTTPRTTPPPPRPPPSTPKTGP
jgi:membrane peptidoglycan carboxypeptidase